MRHRPLFLVTLVGEVDDSIYAEYLQHSTGAFFDPPCRQVLVYDASRARSMSPSQRRMQGAWLRQQASLMSLYTVGIAFVLASAVHRGMLTAIHWIAPPKYRHVVVATRDEGIAWALDVLREAEIRVSRPPERI